MTWSKKTKNAEATTTLKTKVKQDDDIGYILTPNYERILVGSSEDQDLIYQEAFNNWSLKTKITESES